MEDGDWPWIICRGGIQRRRQRVVASCVVRRELIYFVHTPSSRYTHHPIPFLFLIAPNPALLLVSSTSGPIESTWILSLPTILPRNILLVSPTLYRSLHQTTILRLPAFAFDLCSRFSAIYHDSCTGFRRFFDSGLVCAVAAPHIGCAHMLPWLS
jgi:hypothetical protein